MPAQRHRLIYTAAEILSEARIQSQALATARAAAQHSWGPLVVLLVAVPLVGMCGAFIILGVVLSVPELRKKMFVMFAVSVSQVRPPAVDRR